MKLLRQWLQTRRLKRELSAWWAERERNIAARKQARLNNQTYVGGYVRRRAG